jgi:hypothetical protein
MKAIRVLRVKVPGKSLLIRSSLMSRASPLCVCPKHGPHLGPDSLIVRAVTNSCEPATESDAQLTCTKPPPVTASGRILVTQPKTLHAYHTLTLPLRKAVLNVPCTPLHVFWIHHFPCIPALASLAIECLRRTEDGLSENAKLTRRGSALETP